MTILIQKAHISDPLSPHHDKIMDIFIRDGVIEQIDPQIDLPSDKTIALEGLHVSPGWVDIFGDAGDPGFEHRETLETASMAAAAGGYTHLFVLPNTKPVVHDKSLVEYVRDKKISSPVTLHPIGAVTRHTEGKELAEIYDMRRSGAVAFSDGIHPIQQAGMMIKALQYVKAFDGVIIQVPDDRSIAPHGLMHEGILSTRLGLQGRPALAEELIIARDIKLTRYAASRLHITGVTLPKSMEYIRRAKQGGIDVTCSVTPHHLYFCDEDLIDYDSILKVDPPFRTRTDMESMLQAVLDGSVDVIASHHLPLHEDRKTCEFEYASPGTIGLETTFGVLGILGVPFEVFLTLASSNPRRIFGLPPATIQVGNMADITLFQPEIRYVFERKDIRSRSKNSPFIGKTLKGKVIGVVNGNKSTI
jgi:dihydroorotase